MPWERDIVIGSWGVDMMSQYLYVLMATLDEWENLYFQPLSLSTFDNLKISLKKSQDLTG